MPKNQFVESRQDIETQLSRLLHPNALSDTPWKWLSQFPRYLKAMASRIEKLSSTSVAKEAAASRELDELWARIDSCDELSSYIDRSALLEYRWMIEEYRVSLFAQSMGTIVKVSPQRLEKQWKKVSG